MSLDAESKLRAELLSCQSLKDNWDGEGAKAPSQDAVKDALTFIDGKPDDILPPKSTEIFTVPYVIDVKKL